MGTLGELAYVNPDKASATAGIPRFRYVDISCLSPTGIAEPEDIAFVDRASAPSRAQRLIKSGDVLVGTVRPERRARGVVPYVLDGHVCSSGICVLRPKEPADSSFIYAVVRDATFTEWCVGRETGTGYPSVSPQDIAAFPLPIPPDEERRRISELAGTLDARVSHLRSVIQMVEQGLRWLVESSDETCKVKDIATQQRAGYNPASSPASLVDHYSLPAFDAGAEPERVLAGSIGSNKLLVKNPSVLVSRLNPATNRTWLCWPSSEVSNSVCSTEYCVLEPRGITLVGLFATLSREETGEELVASTTGTSASHQRVRAEDILDLDVPDPRRLDEAGLAELAALGDVLSAKQSELRSIIEMSGFLLPRLLEGELRVRDSGPVAEVAS